MSDQQNQKNWHREFNLFCAELVVKISNYHKKLELPDNVGEKVIKIIKLKAFIIICTIEHFKIYRFVANLLFILASVIS